MVIDPRATCTRPGTISVREIMGPSIVTCDLNARKIDQGVLVLVDVSVQLHNGNYLFNIIPVK